MLFVTERDSVPEKQPDRQDPFCGEGRRHGDDMV